MPQSRSDKPTTRKSRSASSPESARSAADVTDERYVWSGKVFSVFSISNIEADPWYIRLDVSNLARDDYVLYIEEGPLFATEAPFQVFPPRFESRETPEEGNPLILSSRFELVADPPGSMVQIPPRRQLNITMRLRKDCHERQDFRVTVYRHFGRTRDSDFHKGRPLSREFFQIPESDTCAVEMEVLTRTAHFRPWNLAGKRNHFFWNLAFFGRPLFNRPEFQVQAQNRGSLPVNVRTHLFKAAGPEKKAFGVDGPEEILAPGQECVWTFPLWLRDAEEADQITFEASMEVKNGKHKLKDVAAGDKVSAVYHPYRSLPKDVMALVGIVSIAGFGLLWLLWGIPVLVTPEIGVCFQFPGNHNGELPDGVTGSDFTLAEYDENNTKLNVSSQTEQPSLPSNYETEADGKRVYYCKLSPRWMGYQWPFGWHSFSAQKHTYRVILSDKITSSKNYKDDAAAIEALKFSKPLPPPIWPRLRYAPRIVGNVTFQNRQHTNLYVSFHLTGKAKEASKISVECIVGTQDTTKFTGIENGEAAPVQFDVTDVATTGTTSPVTLIATTDNHYTGHGGGRSVLCVEKTPVTVENFKPQDESANLVADNSDSGVKGGNGGAAGGREKGSGSNSGGTAANSGGRDKGGKVHPHSPLPLLSVVLPEFEQDNKGIEDAFILQKCGKEPDNPGLLAIKSSVLTMKAANDRAGNHLSSAQDEEKQAEAAIEKAQGMKGMTDEQQALVLLAQGYKEFYAWMNTQDRPPHTEHDEAAEKFFRQASAVAPRLPLPYALLIILRIERNEILETAQPTVKEDFAKALKNAPGIISLPIFQDEVVKTEEFKILSASGKT